MKTFRWGILGTGAVSAKFVAGLRSAKNAKALFVASRSMDKARTFATATGIGDARSGYAEAVASGGVDAIYIATPPSEHAAHALMCIESGIPVLVEKPFAFSATDASRIVDAARARSVFAMEAMWTRFLPAAAAMRASIAAQELGEARLVVGNFGSSQVPDPTSNIFNPAVGGGALAHLGVYPLSLAQWFFGTPNLVLAVGSMGPTGVDEDVAFQLRHANGTISSFAVSIRAWAPDHFQVFCSQGMMAFRGSIVRPNGLDVSRELPVRLENLEFSWRSSLRQHPGVHRIAQFGGRSSRSKGRRINHYYDGNGYHYEADEVRSCIERGALESATMSLDDSVAVARTADMIRELIKA